MAANDKLGVESDEKTTRLATGLSWPPADGAQGERERAVATAEEDLSQHHDPQERPGRRLPARTRVVSERVARAAARTIMAANEKLGVESDEKTTRLATGLSWPPAD